MRGRARRAGVLALVLGIVLVPGAAYSAGTISGTVRALEAPQAPIAGALVTVAAPDQPPITTTTAANGTFSVNVGGNGPYSVGIQAAGYAAKSAAGVQPGSPQDVAMDSATFTPLSLHSGSTMSMAADARSGIFYAAMNQAPELYRTLDHGGSWQPVAMRYEDPDTGLNRPPGALDALTASSISGEVAVVTGGKEPGCCGGVVSGHRVHFSTDYGVTWRTIAGLLPFVAGAARPHFLFWGHASPTSPNALLVAKADGGGNWSVWRANMAVPVPTFVKEPTDPFGTGSTVAGADSAGGSFIGRVSASGELSFAPLTATGPLAFGPTEAVGLPTPPVMLRLGGTRELAAPPNGALVVGGSGPSFAAQMLTKAAGTPTFTGGSASSSTPVSADHCRFMNFVFDVPTGSVAPTAAGDSGSGTVGLCWVTKSGTGPLDIFKLCCSDSDLSYDAAWGQGNYVAFMGHPDGPHKSARLEANGAPDFNPTFTASGGTDPSSGGISVNGMVSPVVEDTDYGPAGAQQLAVAAPGGQLSIASQNGGQSFAFVVNRGWGSKAVEWWQGSSGAWLLFGHGHGGSGNQLAAVLDWDGTTSVGSPNVIGSRPEDLGGVASSGYNPQSLAAIPGSDSVFIGLGFGFDPIVDTGNHLYRARLVPSNPPSLTDVFSLNPALGGPTLYLPKALAYCPSSSADSRMRDVLFVATGDAGGLVGPADTKGSLLRITGATSGAPAVSEIPSVPHGTPQTVLYDVRADCSRGVVYTGGQNRATLYKSTDAGLTFAAITLSGPGGAHMDTIGGITAIGLNPANPNDIKVAAGQGFITHSTDGGSSWTIINDPDVHRPIGVNDIEFPPSGAGPSAVGLSAAAPRPALLGTNSGAFKAELAVSRGVLGVTAAAGGTRRTQTQITALGSDSHPAAVVGANGSASAVFRRANALHYVSTSGGSWSLPSEIPGTARATLPAVALDPAGGLNVAFARSGSAPGIYVTRRAATGVWSAPRRISSGARDALPEIAMTGAGAGHIAFLRTRGRARGIYYSSSRSGRWTKPAKVRGTRAADASAALGGPSLDAFAGRVHLAFARGGPARGIYYAARRGSRWTAFRRLTRSRDVQPALAVDLKGARHIVFRRASGKRAGLFALRGARRWSLARIAGTSRRDAEPAVSLSTSGATIILAFARPTGPTPGVYYDARGLNGRWLPKPRRWSTSAKDRNPSVHSDVRGRLTVVFERG